MSTVSVVVPCYNGAPFLRQSLESALAQTHPPLEIIFVDDGSTDESPTIAESYGSAVKVIRQPNLGESVARNRGIDESKGNWIALLDADDVWRPTKLERQLSAVARCPEAVCVHTNSFQFGAASGLWRSDAVCDEMRYSLSHMCMANPIHVSSLIVRRELPLRFPTWTRHAEDLIYCLGLVQKNYRILLVDEPLTGYRRHASSQSDRLDIEVLWVQTLRRWLSENRSLIDEREAGALDVFLHRRDIDSRLWYAARLRRAGAYGAAARQYQQMLRDHIGPAEALLGLIKLLPYRMLRSLRTTMR